MENQPKADPKEKIEDTTMNNNNNNIDDEESNTFLKQVKGVRVQMNQFLDQMVHHLKKMIVPKKVVSKEKKKLT